MLSMWSSVILRKKYGKLLDSIIYIITWQDNKNSEENFLFSCIESFLNLYILFIYLQKIIGY